jgi:hypothetical protein
MRLSFLTFALFTAGCATSSSVARPDRPVANRWATNTVAIDIDAPLDEVFRFVVAEDAPGRVLRRYGPVPSPTQSQLLDGAWGRVGARRVVVLSNGGTLKEEITAFDPPALYAYRISDFHFFVKNLSSSGTGVWQFFRVGDQTRVVWTYAFQPRSAGSKPLLELGVSWFYRPFMKRGIEETKRQVEAAWRAHGAQASAGQ